MSMTPSYKTLLQFNKFSRAKERLISPFSANSKQETRGSIPFPHHPPYSQCS